MPTASPPSETVRSDAPPVTAGSKVLLVDPDPDFTAQFGRLCAERSWHLTTARTAPEALDGWDPEVDVVVVELGLPGIDGFALLEQMRAFPGGSEAIVLLLSAAPPGPAELRDKLEASGALEFHHKPLSLTAFGARVDALLQATGSMVLEPELTQAGRWLCPEVDRRLAAAGTELPTSGPYGAKELLDLLLGLLAHRRSGVLRLAGERQREIHVHQGWPVEVESDAPNEDLLTLAAEQGHLKPTKLPKLLARQRSYKMSAAEVLANAEQLSVPKIRTLQEAQIGRVVQGALSGRGWFEFFPDPPGREDLRAGVSPLPLLLDSLDRIDVGELGGDLVSLAGQQLLPGPEWKRVADLPAVPRDVSRLLDRIRNRTTLEEALAMGDDADRRIRVLWLLLRVRAILARPA